ncbi:hypothetical protein ACOME3_003551 [Neoechinorhynchus agilis]
MSEMRSLSPYIFKPPTMLALFAILVFIRSIAVANDDSETSLTTMELKGLIDLGCPCLLLNPKAAAFDEVKNGTLKEIRFLRCSVCSPCQSYKVTCGCGPTTALTRNFLFSRHYELTE